MTEKQYERTQDIPVQLTGQDGNVYAIIGAVSKALKRAGFRAEATEFETKALNAESYDAVLRLCIETVDVH